MEILIFILILLGFTIFFFFIALKSFKASKNADMLLVEYVEGIKDFNGMFLIKRTDQRLDFTQKGKILNHIAFFDIASIDINREIEEHHKDKSVIGRAIAGGIILGPIGAIVGGMSGVSPTVHKKENLYLVINLKNSNSIIFRQPAMFSNPILLNNFIGKTIQQLNI
jgi:hypothetical protein